MQKIIGAILIMAACTATGMKRSYAVSEEIAELKELLQMTVFLKGEIGGCAMGLGEAFAQTALRLREPYASFLSLAAARLKEKRAVSLGEIFAECEKETLQKSFLGKDERRCLQKLGNCLGYLDKEVQLEQLELYQKELEFSIAALREEMPGKKKMYQGLGILVGLMIVVLIW